MMSDSQNRPNSTLFPSSSIPPQPHINPMFSIPSSVNSRVHINPNFTNSYSSTNSGSNSSVPPSKVLLNPKFKGSPPSSPQKQIVPVPSHTTMHINPKFANRPLPSVPPPPKPARSSLARNMSLSTTSLPRSQHQARENIYARVGGEMPPINRSKKEQFEESIKKSLENKTVLINPNFGVSKATHPSKPARHSLMITSEMSKKLENELQRNRRKEHETPKVSLDKENVPSAKSKINLFTPLRKSAFKKIGSRKLVRVKRKSGGSPGTPNASFKKIGSKKLIRIQESTAKDKCNDQGSMYQVKTKTKIVKSVKNTPTNTSKYRFSFITPISLRRPSKLSNKNSGSLKKSSGKKRLSSFRSRFKLDRRTKSVKAEPKVLFQGSGQQPRLKKLSGTTYRVSATKLSKVQAHAPSKPHRTKHLAQPHPTLANSKVITVQGIKFSVAENGRKLKRIPTSPSPSLSYSASVSQSCATSTSPGQASTSPLTDNKASPANHNTSTATVTSKKVYLGGEEFDEVEPGVFSRSRHSLTRQSITQAKNRSINTIIKNANRSKQYCMFYNKFGKCTKKETGSCPFLHDQDKVAVCRRFLQGSCIKEKCLLSHKVAPEKMPACKYFLEGVCSREDCPYLHVKVSAKAEICQAFLKGYCSNGSDCKQRHVMACPEFDRTGNCGKVSGKCPFPHVIKAAPEGRTPETTKRIPPAKPKRKSLGQTPDHSTKKSRVQARYYEDKKGDQAMKDSKGEESNEMEAKRKRLLQKIELAKKGWTGVTVSVPGCEETVAKLDDSGPYEKIDSASSDEERGQQSSVTRQPMGQLGDFISLAGYSSEEEELCTDRRLI